MRKPSASALFAHSLRCASAGGQDERNAQYGPFTPGFVRVPHCLEYRAFEQDGAPSENYGVWAADQIEKVILAEYDYENYQTIAGIQFPFRITKTIDGNIIDVNIGEVSLGIGASTSIFKLPK